MLNRNLIREWIIKACDLHPDTQEFCGKTFGEFEYVANCAYRHAQRPWEPLTDAEIRKAAEVGSREYIVHARAIEEALRKKNT